MGVINPDWYAANATRAYPLDDAATARDDAGRELPSQILVDCRIRFPMALGKYAYISGVTVGPSIVTVTFLAAPDALRPPGGAPAVGADFQPLGAVTLPRPVQPNRHYPIQPMAVGVGGWLVFGRGIDDPYSGRFSSPIQSLLLPRIATAYHPLPIPTLGKLGLDQALSGVVKLLGSTDIEVIQGVRTIGEAHVDAVVIRLVNSLNRNVFDLYKGPCGGRPESGNCDKPSLQTLNTVEPDCAGNLIIDFQGAVVSEFVDGGGFALDIPLGMADACLGQDYLPDASGTLPGEYADQCPEGELVEPPPTGDVPPPGYSDKCTPLPYYESFDAGFPGVWASVIGDHAIEDDDSPGEPFGLEIPGTGAQSGHPPGFPGLPPLHRASGTPEVGLVPVNKCLAVTNISKRNVMIWNCGQPAGTEMTCTTHLKVMPGASANGGLVFNYFLKMPYGQSAQAQRGYEVYSAYLINPITNSLEQWVYISGGVTATNRRVAAWPASTGVNQLVVGDWYQLSIRWGQITVTDTNPNVNRWRIQVKVSGVTKPAFKPLDILGSFTDMDVVVSGRNPLGAWGVGSVNAHCRFSFFQVDETPLKATTT